MSMHLDWFDSRSQWAMLLVREVLARDGVGGCVDAQLFGEQVM